MQKKFLIPAVAGLASLALVGGVGVANALDTNEVSVVVDGVSKTVEVREDTVADVLSAQGIAVGEHDVVLPAADSDVTEGLEINVAYGRALNLTVDGKAKTVWTTARTVDEALAYLNLDAADSLYSTSRSTGITREGLDLAITTAKDVTLTAAGKTTNVTLAGTVADVLKRAGITADADDRVTPAVTTELADGMKISFVKVDVKTSEKMVAIPFTKTSVKSSKLTKGTEKVTTKGVDGAYRDTYTDVYADGVLESSTRSARVRSAAPVQQVTTVGTKVVEVKKETTTESSTSTKSSSTKSSTSTKSFTSSSSSSSSSDSSSTSSSSGAGLNLARTAMWDRIAQCESSGNWSINTGNGYYGGLQFNLATWRSVNGTDFAAYPHQATRAEQITVANRLYAQRGTQPWSCA